MIQEMPSNVDTGDALHKIDLRGKIGVNWRDKHRSHIQVWNTGARLLCHGARLEGDMSPTHPYFHWYNRVTWRFVDHTSAALLIMVIASTFLFKFCCFFSIFVAYHHFCVRCTNCIYIYNAGYQSQVAVDALYSRQS